MTSLSTRVRLAEKPNPSNEDILNDFAETLYPDRYQNIHGDPGSEITYTSPRHGDIHLMTAAPDKGDNVFLFAHYLWNAGIQLANFISEGSQASIEAVAKFGEHDDKVSWSVKGEKVLELGAGTGLVGIMSASAGAKDVVISDYPSLVILETLKTNVARNVKPDRQPSVRVAGHDWGILTDDLAINKAGSFTRVLAADCTWMRDKQEALLSSIQHFLSPSPDSRVWIVAGFHTGREAVATFFERACDAGFGTENIWERDVNGNERSWDPRRDGIEDDIEYRRKWLVVAILKRQLA